MRLNSLNAVGGQMWQLLTEGGEIETAMQQLSQVYAVDESTSLQDIAMFLEELLHEGLLQEAGE